MLIDRLEFYKNIFGMLILGGILLFNADINVRRMKKDGELLGSFIIIFTVIIGVESIIFAKIPYVANELHEVIEGTVVDMQWDNKTQDRLVKDYYNGNAEVNCYNINLKIGEEIKKYKSVYVKDPIKEGDEIRIHIYKSIVPSRVITRINGKMTKYFEYGYKYSKMEESLFFWSIIFIGGIYVVLVSYKYYKYGKKAKGWYRVAVISMIVYLSSFIISKKYPSYSNALGIGMAISLGIYAISLIGVYWKSLNVEETLTVPENKNQEISQIQELQIINEEISEPKGAEPKNIEKGYPICQFTPVSNTFSRKYCTYRYKAERKEWFQMTVTISGLFIGFGSAIVLAMDGKEAQVIKAGSLLLLLIVSWYCWREKNKCKKFKQAVKDSRPCEICEVKMALGKEHKYIYSNGQEKIVWMEWDMEGKIKDGEPAVIVYIPLADKFYTDKPETIEMIKEKY